MTYVKIIMGVTSPSMWLVTLLSSLPKHGRTRMFFYLKTANHCIACDLEQHRKSSSGSKRRKEIKKIARNIVLTSSKYAK